MSQIAQGPRRFSVHARHVDRHGARIVLEPTFEAAAIAYVEDLAPFPAGEPELSIIVRDLDSGHQHCFRVNLETGEAGPCA
jgi:hypothetical protein